MKQSIVILCILFSGFLFSQKNTKKDVYKNSGYFNISKITYYKINNAYLDFVAADNSTTRDNVEGNAANGHSLQTINGVFLSPKFSLGLGIGLENFNSPNANTMPVFLDARYYLDNNYNTLYGFANIGALVKPDDTFKKGGMIGAGIGYKFFINTSKTIALVADAGYFHRYIKIPFQNNPNQSSMVLNGLSFSVGVIF